MLSMCSSHASGAPRAPRPMQIRALQGSRLDQRRQLACRASATRARSSPSHGGLLGPGGAVRWLGLGASCLVRPVVGQLVEQVLVGVLHGRPAGARQVHHRLKLLALLVPCRALQQACNPRVAPQCRGAASLQGTPPPPDAFHPGAVKTRPARRLGMRARRRGYKGHLAARRGA